MNRLQPGENLRADQFLTSPNGLYKLVLQGADSNVVLYRIQDGKPLWATHQSQQLCGSLEMQGDGNLVQYDTHGTPLWASNTFVHGSYAELRNDGSLVTVCEQPIVKEVVGADPDPLPVPEWPELPRLVVNGQFFMAQDGTPFTAIQCSDFNLLNRWQHGENIEPVLKQRRDAGYNMLRVWTLYDLATANIGVFLDIDYDRVPAFLDLCEQYGFYVEFTAYTSTERPEHWDNLVIACQSRENVLLELVNEGTLAVNQIDMARYARPSGVLASHGSGGSEGIPPWTPWDYCTFHTNGSSEEQRKIGHNAMSDLADVHHVPALTNETSRFPEVGMWRHGNAVQLATDSAAGAALLCAGSCFHSVQGKTSVLWDAAHLEVATAWARGARSVPLTCQHAPYKHRVDLETPGVLRAYQRGNSAACVVLIHE